MVCAIQENDDLMFARLHVYLPAIGRSKAAERWLRLGLAVNLEENDFVRAAQYRYIGQGAGWFAVEISRGSAACDQCENQSKGQQQVAAEKKSTASQGAPRAISQFGPRP